MERAFGKEKFGVSCLGCDGKESGLQFYPSNQVLGFTGRGDGLLTENNTEPTSVKPKGHIDVCISMVLKLWGTERPQASQRNRVSTTSSIGRREVLPSWGLWAMEVTAETKRRGVLRKYSEDTQT